MTFASQLSPQLREYGEVVQAWSLEHCRPFARVADVEHAAPEGWQEILDTAPVPIGRWDKPEDPLPKVPEGHWVRELVLEESLSYGDVWPMFVLSKGIGHLVVEAMGTPEQRERWYDPVMNSGAQTAFALTEPGFGSDTSRVQTTAVQDGDSWVINGPKMYCSLGSIGEYVTVFASVDKSLGGRGIAAFVVPRGTPGYQVVKANEDKLGIRAAQTSELLFDNCRVPLENRLGWDSGGPSELAGVGGQSGALSALSENRPNISAMSIGIAQASIDIAAERLIDGSVPAVGGLTALFEAERRRMDAALDRARHVNRHAQQLVDEGRPDRSASAAAKAYGPQTSERVIRRCMQWLGVDGVSQELLLEKWYRDVKIMDIFEGSGQIQRIIVGRGLMGRLVG